MFKYQGVGSYVGAEEYGPPRPTVTQQATQMVKEVDTVVEQSTGLKNFAMYLGIALIGYVAYTYMQE